MWKSMNVPVAMCMTLRRATQKTALNPGRLLKTCRMTGFAPNAAQKKSSLRRSSNHCAQHTAKSYNLEETNTALRVLLKEREKDKEDLEEKVVSNVRKMVLPYLEKLKKTSLDNDQRSCVDLLESNLNDIVSPFSSKLSSKYLSLTPTEIRVANLVKDGKTTKEIAEFMNLSDKTIQTHRGNIRNKTGIKHKKRNLRTYLLAL